MHFTDFKSFLKVLVQFIAGFLYIIVTFNVLIFRVMRTIFISIDILEYFSFQSLKHGTTNNTFLTLFENVETYFINHIA